MKPKYETTFRALIRELGDMIKYNDQAIKEILPDQRFIEALHYQIENSAIEKVIEQIESTLEDLTQAEIPAAK